VDFLFFSLKFLSSVGNFNVALQTLFPKNGFPSTGPGAAMASEHDELYVIYLRSSPDHELSPDVLERPLITCYSYGEARRIRRLLQDSPHDCVIRYLGHTGGGD
jgi:hypothetical protein